MRDRRHQFLGDALHDQHRAFSILRQQRCEPAASINQTLDDGIYVTGERQNKVNEIDEAVPVVTEQVE